MNDSEQCMIDRSLGLLNAWDVVAGGVDAEIKLFAGVPFSRHYTPSVQR